MREGEEYVLVKDSDDIHANGTVSTSTRILAHMRRCQRIVFGEQRVNREEAWRNCMGTNFRFELHASLTEASAVTRAVAECQRMSRDWDSQRELQKLTACVGKIPMPSWLA
jgi:hypothetical protein